jgi:hypothetical protein
MAEAATEKGLTSTIDESKYDLRKYRGKWATKKEFKIVNKVWERLRAMRSARQRSCYFPSTKTATADTVSGNEASDYMDGSDWMEAWDRWDKQWLMFRKILDETVNIKSPMSFSPTEAALAEFMDGDIVPLINNVEVEDDEKVKLIGLGHEWLRRYAKMNKVNYSTFHEAAIKGTSIRYVGFFDKKLEGREMIQNVDELQAELKKAREEKNKDRIKEITEILDSGKPLTKKEDITEYNNIGHVMVPLPEFYIDPDAQELRDHMYEASDCSWVQTPSLEQCLAEFKDSNDPWVIKANVDKIVSSEAAREAYGEDTPFYKPPKDIQAKTQVELVRYYNKRTDKYIVLANDVVIRNGPLPYNHKQLPFVVHRFVKKEGQFYGFGLPAILENPQTYSEILMSMHLEQAMINSAPPMLYNTQYGEDIDAWERYGAGQKIGINGPIDDSVVRWMPTSNPNLEYNSIQQELETKSIQMTGINPMAYAVPKAGEAVRTHMMTMESTLKIVRKYIKYWGEGWVEGTWMDIRLMQQFWPLLYKEEFDGNERIKKYQTIRTEGKDIEIEEGEDGLMVNINDSTKKGSFEMKSEYLELAGDFDIELDMNSITPPSEALMMQKSEQALAQLFPILQNQGVLQAPGVMELVKWYGETHHIPTKVFELMQDSSNDEDAEYAENENKMMLRGNVVPGTPGSSPLHIMQHTQALTRLISKRTELMNSMAMNDPMMPMDENSMIMEEQRIARGGQAIDNQISIMSEHITVDSMPKEIAGQAMVQMGQPPAPPQPPQNGMVPPPMEGGQGMGMMPTAPTGMEGMPGGEMGMPV